MNAAWKEFCAAISKDSGVAVDPAAAEVAIVELENIVEVDAAYPKEYKEQFKRYMRLYGLGKEEEL